MKIYMAGQFNTKEQRLKEAQLLAEHGITVTSRWMYESIPHTANIKDLPDIYHAETAVADLQDIDDADALLMFLPTEKELIDTPLRAASRGGRHFEMGYAYRAGKLIYVIGPQENVFHFLPTTSQTCIRHFESLNGFIAYIQAKKFRGNS